MWENIINLYKYINTHFNMHRIMLTTQLFLYTNPYLNIIMFIVPSICLNINQTKINFPDLLFLLPSNLFMYEPYSREIYIHMAKNYSKFTVKTNLIFQHFKQTYTSKWRHLSVSTQIKIEIMKKYFRRLWLNFELKEIVFGLLTEERISSQLLGLLHSKSLNRTDF